VEAVCDHVLVLARGRLLAQGKIQELKQAHANTVEVRVKRDPAGFARRLTESGCGVEPNEDLLVVSLPDGGSSDLLWRLAASAGEQVRYLRPRRGTLEEVFLKAVEDGSV
jgi:ABC-2 type transport system ATP-binding protein